jgi:hypothetical protein
MSATISAAWGTGWPRRRHDRRLVKATRRYLKDQIPPVATALLFNIFALYRPNPPDAE